MDAILEHARLQKEGEGATIADSETRTIGGTPDANINTYEAPSDTRRHSIHERTWEMCLALLLVFPPVVFLVYAGFIKQHEGQKADTAPIPALQAATKYGPTIFPILFAGVVGGFLSALAAWRLEQGISILSLEYLLRSRTVVGTITTPFSLRTINVLAPLLILLWALSPLGGQAALRLMTTIPSTTIVPWDFHYLEFMSDLPHRGPLSSAGADMMPATIGAFSAALSSPADSKSAKHDLFGNVKVPMIESCRSAGASVSHDGWFDELDLRHCSYTSVTGLPVSGASNDNYTFLMETSYMYTNCSLNHVDGLASNYSSTYMQTHPMYNNNLTLVMQPTGFAGVYGLRNGSQTLVFTSFTMRASGTTASNATCALSTSYVEANVSCHRSDCWVRRLRPSQKPRNDTSLTVLDGLTNGPSSGGIAPSDGFFRALLDSTDTPWTKQLLTDPYSSPLEYYFTNPGSPYSAQVGDDKWRGADIYPIGDKLFSERFSQILNTFWINSIAPFAVTGNFSIEDPSSIPGGSSRYIYQNVTGTMTPDYMVMKCNDAWLAVLIIASVFMLFASLAAVVLVHLRHGPDILNRTSIFVKDHAYGHLDVPTVSGGHAHDQSQTPKADGFHERNVDLEDEHRIAPLRSATGGRVSTYSLRRA